MKVTDLCRRVYKLEFKCIT